MKKIMVFLWGALLFLPVVSYAQLPSLQESRDNQQYRASCDGPNCMYNGTIYLQNVNISGFLDGGQSLGARYYTAKGTQGVIMAGKDVSNCASGGDVVLENGSSPADVDFRAGKEVILKPGFTAKQGCNFHAYVEPKWSVAGTMEFTPGQVLEDEWLFAENGKPILNSVAEQARSQVTVNSNNELSVTLQQVNGSYKSGFIASKRHIHTANEPFGRYEAEAIVPSGEGISGAIWLLTSNHGFNGEMATVRPSDEIDIIEGFPLFSRNQTSTNVHMNHAEGLSWLMSNGEVYRERPVSGMYDFTTTWHLYAFEWEEDEMRFLIDDCVVYRLPNRYMANRYDFPKHAVKEPVQWLVSLPFNTHSNGTAISPLRTLPVSLRIKALRYLDKVSD